MACPVPGVSGVCGITLHSAESGLAVILGLSQRLDALPVIKITIRHNNNNNNNNIDTLPVSGGQHRVPGHDRVIRHQCARLRSEKHKPKLSN